MQWEIGFDISRCGFSMKIWPNQNKWYSKCGSGVEGWGCPFLNLFGRFSYICKHFKKIQKEILEHIQWELIVSLFFIQHKPYKAFNITKKKLTPPFYFFRFCQGAIAGKGPSGMAAAKRRQSQQNSELDQDKFQLPIIILGSAENNTIPIIGANWLHWRPESLSNYESKQLSKVYYETYMTGTSQIITWPHPTANLILKSRYLLVFSYSNRSRWNKLIWFAYQSESG